MSIADNLGMELRDWAQHILLEPSIEHKLQAVDLDALTDHKPGDPIRIAYPARPEKLSIEQWPKIRGAHMPKPQALADKRLRAVSHHVMANHELQALEVMAWMLLAFPEAPPAFRRGLAWIMHEEQLHTQMHIVRMRQLGHQLGDFKVNAHVWIRTRVFHELLDYVSCVPLVFENANLDHSLEFAERYTAVGDSQSCKIMHRIHDDEIRHVAFGWQWLNRLKPADQTAWQTFCQHVHLPTKPHDAKGEPFQWQARQKAGLDDDFIGSLEQEARPIGTPIRDPQSRVTSILQTHGIKNDK